MTNSRAGKTKISLGDAQNVTIASGITTYERTNQKVTVESGSTDDLVTVTGGKEGDIMILTAADDTKTIVCKDSTTGTDTLRMAGDFSLDTDEDKIMFIKMASQWHEISRSNNNA